MAKIKSHGGALGTVPCGLVRYTVCRDGAVLKASATGPYKLYAKTPDAKKALDTLRKSRDESPFASYWDLLNTIPAKSRALVHITITTALDPDYAWAELNDLGIAVALGDIKAMVQSFVDGRAEARLMRDSNR